MRVVPHVIRASKVLLMPTEMFSEEWYLDLLADARRRGNAGSERRALMDLGRIYRDESVTL